MKRKLFAIMEEELPGVPNIVAAQVGIDGAPFPLVTADKNRLGLFREIAKRSVNKSRPWQLVTFIEESAEPFE